MARALGSLTRPKALLIFAFLSVPGWVGCSGLVYQPDRKLYYLPSRLGLEASEYALTTPEGETLYAWFLPARSPKGTIIQFHGNAENMSSHYLSLVWLVREGYSLFVFDYEGYGKSTGEPTQKKTHNDGLLALRKAMELHKQSGARKFIVVGQSLGGAVAARALADFEQRSEVSLVVLESTFASYKEAARRLLASHWYTWPLSWLPLLAISDEYAPKASLKSCDYRLLIIHDRRDPVVSFECGKTIDEVASCPRKEFWELNRGRHIAAFAEDESANRERFVKLLDSL